MNTTFTRVDLAINDNVWWDDQFQYGDPIDFTWNFSGKAFYLTIKHHDDDATAVVTYTSGAGQIVVEDATNRVIGMLVSDVVLRTTLTPGEYVYDLIMVDNITGQTDGLMGGELHVAHGITVGPS